MRKARRSHPVNIPVNMVGLNYDCIRDEESGSIYTRSYWLRQEPSKLFLILLIRGTDTEPLFLTADSLRRAARSVQYASWYTNRNGR